MSTIARSTKAGGTTDVQNGETIQPSDVNTDMNTLFGDYNGGITNVNLSASAAVAYTKLALSDSIVNGDLVDGTLLNGKVNASADIALTKLADTSGTAAAAATTADPGVSNSESLATTADGELLRLRYAIERIALGVDATRYDDTGSAETTYWGDVPVRGMQRLPGFNGVVTSGLPSGWSNVATATLAQEAADAADKTAGKGRAIKITAAGSANEGISYTLSGLKASTKYLITALMKATSGDTAKLDCTGGDATSAFRNFTATTTNTAWTWLSGVVQTDATPTNIVVRCLAAADTDIVWVADVQYGECAVAPLAPRVAVIEQQIAATAGTVITGSTTDAGLDTNYQFIDDGTNDLDKTVYVPGDGYYIRITAEVSLEETAGAGGGENVVTWRIYESVNGAALAAKRTRQIQVDHSGTDNVSGRVEGSMVYIVKNPTPGASYRYAVAATKSNGTQTFTPQEGNEGSSALTIEVLPY